MFEENIIETEVSSNTIETESDSLIGTPGIDGVTFTPSVSQEGIISWTNNGGLPNPEPINIKGIPGANGIDGAKGEKGDKGDKGDKGEKGDRGEQGIQGPQGVPGLQGIQGEKGDKGDKGEPGIQGPKGDLGEQGLQGPKGDKGEKGADGLPININVNGNTYSHTNGTITLPDYPLKENLGYKVITSPDLSVLDAGLYIYAGDETYIMYGTVQGPFKLRPGYLLYFYKYNNIRETCVFAEDGLQYISGSNTNPFSKWKTVAYADDIPYFTHDDVKRWNNAVKTMISSDTFNSIVVVDSLTNVEEEEGVLYLVRENSEPVRDYVTKPTIEMGDISTYGTLKDSSSYCRTARYVYVHGKSSIVLSNSNSSSMRVFAYDKNKTFMENWYTDSGGGKHNYKSVDDGGSMNIPEGAYYIKARFSSSTVKPLTITYNDVVPV